MTNLILNVKKKWFDLFKSGEKQYEYRGIKSYWTKRLVGKQYENVVIVCGYPKIRDENNSIVFPWRGFLVTTTSNLKVIQELGIEDDIAVYAVKCWR